MLSTVEVFTIAHEYKYQANHTHAIIDSKPQNSFSCSLWSFPRYFASVIYTYITNTELVTSVSFMLLFKMFKSVWQNYFCVECISPCFISLIYIVTIKKISFEMVAWPKDIRASSPVFMIFVQRHRGLKDILTSKRPQLSPKEAEIEKSLEFARRFPDAYWRSPLLPVSQFCVFLVVNYFMLMWFD